MCVDSQSSRFLASEGDAWFESNPRGILGSEALDVNFICKSLQGFKSEIANILEVGCAGGEKLSLLCDFFEAHGNGVDPSNKAIEYAKDKFKDAQNRLEFSQGLATELPFEDEHFDLIFFGFCLYLIPPQEISAVMAAAERVLRPGGFIAILDFDYGDSKVNPYKHAKGIYAYKDNYSSHLLKTNRFHLISKWSYSHFQDTFTKDRDERVSIEVLHKELV